jgi:hypothetical protein
MVKITVIDSENPTAETIIFEMVYGNDNYEVPLNVGTKPAKNLVIGDCIKFTFDGSNVCHAIHTIEVT